MFRDRTNLFVSYRQTYTHHPYISHYDAGKKGSAGADPFASDALLIPGDAEAVEMTSLAPVWLDLSEELDTELADLKTTMGQLAPLYKRNSLPGFDDRTELEREIQKLSVRCAQSLHRCQDLIKQFDRHTKEEHDPNMKRMCENIKVAMASKVQDSSTIFRKMQSSYLRALRKDVSLEGQGTSMIDQDVSYSQQSLRQMMHQPSSVHDHEALQREREIQQIAEGILEVADIFKDLETMVIDQGTLIDRVDYNIEMMHTHVKEADQQLLKGSRLQQQTQKCKIILLLILVIVGLFLILIFKPRSRSSSSPAPAPAPAPTPAPASIPTQNPSSKLESMLVPGSIQTKRPETLPPPSLNRVP